MDYRRIFTFWVPLASTWLMMSVEGPYLAAVIARLAEPKFNLAAYGVAWALALICEAPIIMIMSASTALCRDRDSFLKVRNFTYTLNAGITAVMLLGVIPPVFRFIAMGLIGLPAEVSHLTHIAAVILLPWPGAIGYRRLYHGVLIRNNRTRYVAYGTIIRLCAMSLTALILALTTDLAGAWVGAAALAVGVSFEAMTSRFMARDLVRRLLAGELVDGTDEEPLTYRYIIHFYLPLALTSILALGVQPMVTFFVGKSRFPIESLAVLPVVTSLTFIFRSLGLSFQEVVIALMGKNFEHYRVLRNFGMILGVGTVTGMALLAFTPAAGVWFETISGLSPELSRFALVPTRILALMPGLTVLLSMQRSILVTARHTGPITWATLVEVVTIVTVLWISIGGMNAIGAVAAAAALVIGRLLSNSYLMPAYLRITTRA